MALFPTDSDTNTLSTSTFAGGTGTGHAVSTGEVSSVSKFGSFVLGAKNLLNYVKGTVDLVINNNYRVRAYNSTAQALTSGAFTRIQFPTEVYDLNNNWNTTTHRYTAPVTGYYSINASIQVAMSGAGFIILALYKNGVVLTRYSRTYTPSAQNIGGLVADVVNLNAGDFIEIFIFTNITGSTLENLPNGEANTLSVNFIGF